MKKNAALLVILAMLLAVCSAPRAKADDAPFPYGDLLVNLLEAYNAGARVDPEEAARGDSLALAVARWWDAVYLDPDYRLYLYGKDDPAELPVAGAHAFVVLGYQLQDGQMTEELKARCGAAAAAALAFPDSLVVCSGGATGNNNPKGNTEAGLMRDYLIELGVAPERIFIDEKAQTTAQNAVNTFAILREQGVDAITVVTSAYHQRRGTVLYAVMAALTEQEYGNSVAIAGNYCCEIDNAGAADRDAGIAAMQLGTILGLSEEELEPLKGVFTGGAQRFPGKNP